MNTQHFLKTALLILLLPFWSDAQESYPCPINGNAENGNFSNWATYKSIAESPQYLNNFIQQNTIDPNIFGVHDPFIEKNFPQTLNNAIDMTGDFPIPSEGTYCFRINNAIQPYPQGGRASLVRYTFTVTPQNMHFKLRYALVFEDGIADHDMDQNPSALFYFTKGTTIYPSVFDFSLWAKTFRSFTADMTNPYYKKSSKGGSKVYRSWECLEFDLSEYVGQTLSFIAMVKDCLIGGHFGYMYLDGLCTNWPAIASGFLNKNQYCLEETISLNGAASEGEDKYYVSVVEMKQDNMYEYEPGGLDISQWFSAQQAPSNFNVSAFVSSKGKKLECGKKYKVKLAVANACSEWNETNMWFDIVCPKINAGPDITACCTREGGAPIQKTITTHSSPIFFNSYSWSSIPAGFTANTPSAITSSTKSTAYIVEMKTYNGCKARDTVLVKFTPKSPQITLTKNYLLCDYAPYVNATIKSFECTPSPDFEKLFETTEDSQIKWTFKPTNSNLIQILGTGKSIHAPNADGVLTATYTASACNNETTSASVSLYYRPGGHTLITPNAFTPNGDGINDVFRILETGPNAPENIGEGPAYGVSDYKLHIWDRWGTNFKTLTKADAGRSAFENPMQGDISWDGKNQYGTLVQDGTYYFTLEVKYCKSSRYDYVCPIDIKGIAHYPCLKHFLSFCTKSLGECGGKITVLK